MFREPRSGSISVDGGKRNDISDGVYAKYSMDCVVFES